MEDKHYLVVDLEATCCDQGSIPREETETIEIETSCGCCRLLSARNFQKILIVTDGVLPNEEQRRRLCEITHLVFSAMLAYDFVLFRKIVTFLDVLNVSIVREITVG